MSSTPEVIVFPVGSNPMADPSRHREDGTRWRSITEHSIFLNDGVLRCFGLVPCPFTTKSDAALSSPSSDTEIDIENLKNSSKTIELQERLLRVCTASPSMLRQYHAFHFNLIRKMWLWKHKNATKQRALADNSSPNKSSSGLITDERNSVFTGSKLSLLLLIPLLKSQAALDKELATETAKIMLAMLMELPGMSLGSEFHVPLDQLESLFEHWIRNQGHSFQEIGPSVMVGLCCARGSMSSFVKTIGLLEGRVDKIALLPVRKILQNLPRLNVRIGKTCRLTGSRHIVTWQYDDHLTPMHKYHNPSSPSAINDSENIPPPPSNDSSWHALATDGKYLFVTSAKGKGIAKIGTGFHGTLQGYRYHHNNNLVTDFMALGNGVLVSKLMPGTGPEFEITNDNLVPFGTVIDQSTLEPAGTVWIRMEDEFPRNTIAGLTSDGFYFYMVHLQLPPGNDEALRTNGSSENEVEKLQVPVYLDVFQITKSEVENKYFVSPVQNQILLQREVEVEPVTDLENTRRHRLTYLAATSQGPTPPPPIPLDPTGERMTSLGIRVKDLLCASIISSGNFLTILTPFTSGSSAQGPSASPLIQSLNRHFGNHGSALQNSKVTGTQIQICLLGQMSTCSNGFGGLPPQCSFHRGSTTLFHLGATYDSENNAIWTTSGDFIDMWKNPGHIPPWKQRKQLMIRDLEFSFDSTNVPTSIALNLLWEHVGFLSNHFINGTLGNTTIGLYGENLPMIWEIARKMNFNDFDGTELTALFLVLQATISHLSLPPTFDMTKVLEEIQWFLFDLLSEIEFTTKFPCDLSSGVYFEAARLLIAISESICLTQMERQMFATRLFQLIENETIDRNVAETLKTIYLNRLSERLVEDGILFDKGHVWILPHHFIRKLIAEDSVQHTVRIFDSYSTEEVVTTSMPLVSPATAYIAAAVNCLLKSWTLARDFNLAEDPTLPACALPTLKAVLNHCSTIVDRTIEFASLHSLDKFQNFISMENIMKSSLLGMALPQIYLWLCEHSSRVCDNIHPGQGCPVVEDLAEECVQLFVAISHLSEMTNSSVEFDTAKEDWSTHIENFYPFQNHRFYESGHPVKDSTKLRESVVFNGARRLYVKMDPKSSTQYDYDKLSIYAGAGLTARLVAEYGGNFYGFGNRTGSLAHWPRDMVRIEGDTLSYSLEIRSGKEQQTPPEALWGFAFSVLPVYDSYAAPGVTINLQDRMQTTKPGVLIREKFFVDKISLASIDAMTCILSKHITGEPQTELENQMRSLFTNQILSEFRWPNVNSVGGKDTFLSRISSLRILGLRRTGNANGLLPRMRSKLVEILKPDELEKLYVLAVLKCLEVEKSSEHQDSSEPLSNTKFGFNPLVLHELFRNLDSFIRKLISIAEIQLRLADEVDEVIKDMKKLDETFLYTLNAMDSDAETLAMICDLNFDKNNPSATVSDIRSIVEAVVAEGSHLRLNKAEELVAEAIYKLRYILSAEKRGSDSFWNCDNIEKAKARLSEAHEFITCHLTNQKATMAAILDVIESQSRRAFSRSQGLQLILKLLECSKHNSQSLLMASLLLQKSKSLDDISCSGLWSEINELIGRGIGAVVDKAKPNPLLHRHAIALLCIIQYKLEDELTLVSSGLLELIDDLCALQILGMDLTVCKTLEQKATESGNSSDTAMIKSTASLAWAAFQVLAHCCSSWQTDENEEEFSQHEKVALPVQISINVTNHLARATAIAQLSSSIEDTSDPAALRICTPVLTEAIQDVLGLLDTLRCKKLGREILMQSPCVCRLISLLLDPRSSPSIVLIIIRLLGTALPLVEILDTSDLQQMNIPLVKKKGIPGGNSSNIPATVVQDPNPHSVVMSLLLSKLADFLVVCGNQQNTTGVTPPKTEDVPETHNSVTNQKTPQLPRVSPPVISIGQGSSTTAKTKSLICEQTCREKNLYLISHDPLRNFLSGEVAAGLAVEITKLIQDLLRGNSKNLGLKSSSVSLVHSPSDRSFVSSSSGSKMEVKQKLWSLAAEQALLSSLKPLPKLGGLLNPMTVSLDAYAVSARICIAALGVLGSLNDTIKIGSEVWILGSNPLIAEKEGDGIGEAEFWPTKVRVLSVCERTGIAIIQHLPSENEHREITPAKTLRVPLARLSPSKIPNSENLPELSLPVQREIAVYLKSMLLPNAGSSKQTDSIFPLKKPIPTLNHIFALTQNGSSCSTSALTESKAIAQRMTIVRLIAEIRTRAAHVLWIWLKNRGFIEVFLGIQSETSIGNPNTFSADTVTVVNSLKSMAKECKASYRLQSVSSQVTKLRLLYRDCTKPPRLSCPNGPDDGKNYPPGTLCILNGTNTDGAGTSDTGFRLQRISDSLQDINVGTLFPYLADIESESDLSFVMTDTDSDDEFFSPVSSRSNVRNGEPEEEELESIVGGFAPNSASDSASGVSENDEGGPQFSQSFDDEEGSFATSTPATSPSTIPVQPQSRASGKLKTSFSKATCLKSDCQKRVAKPKPENREYFPSEILEYYLSPSTTYDVRVFTGPNPYVCPCAASLESESDLLSLEDDTQESKNTSRRVRIEEAGEDIQGMLVKAWETRVFPVIRRRFRNESERRDGLEQIRTALTMGMIDIARQTVEFLYEENGGVPRDLHFPTLEEIRAEVSRFTVDRIKVGMNVLIHPPKPNSGTQDCRIPKYAVSSMMKTFGLIGEVLEIDPAFELILVESYVESDGVLQRFWYPIKSLERLIGEKKPPPNSRNVNMFKLHSNLVALESSLAQLYCRKAFIEILNLGFGTRSDNLYSSDDSLILRTPKSQSIASLFEELDLGNLEIRSEDSFSEFPLNGDLLTWNLAYGAPPLKFLTEMGNPSALFYKDFEKLTVELNTSIERAYQRGGEDALTDLTSQICAVIEAASEKFLSDEIPLDKEGTVDIHLPETAFTLVAIQGPLPRKSAPVPSVLNREPCVHVYGTNAGDLRVIPLVCYPVQSLGALLKSTTSTYGSLNPGPGIRDRKKSAFPSVLVPTDRITCSISEVSLQGHTLKIQGIPSQFPLALLYCKQLIEFLHHDSSVPEGVGARLLTILVKFLQKTSMPPTIKEWIFMLCSGVLSAQPSSVLLHELCADESAFINRIFTEAVVLYEQETKLHTHLTLNLSFPFSIRVAGGRNPGTPRSTNRQNRTRPILITPVQIPGLPPSVHGIRDLPKADKASTLNTSHGFPIVSSYFQALIELCLNISSMRHDMTYSPATLSPPLSAEVSPVSTPPQISSNAVVVVSGESNSSPTQQLQQQRKAVKTKPIPATPKSNSWKRVGKGGRQLDTKSLGSSSPPMKMEEFSLKDSMEMSWFRQSEYTLLLLKTFSGEYVENNYIGMEVIQNCAEEMKKNTTQSRLFVIYGAPGNLPNMPVEASVTRGLNETGGIYGNELWMSEDQTDIVVEVRTAARGDQAFENLKKNLTWYPIEDFILYPSISIYRVTNTLTTGDRRADSVLLEYLRQKIFSREVPEKLSSKAINVFFSIFTNCYVTNEKHGHFDKSEDDDTGYLYLKKKHILYNVEENLMRQFVLMIKPANLDLDYFVQEVLKKFGQRKEAPSKCSTTSNESHEVLLQLPHIQVRKFSKDGKPVESGVTPPKSDTDDWLGLSESGFVDWCTQLGKDNLLSLWRALLETGHDIRLDKSWVPKTDLLPMLNPGGWTMKQDVALVTYVNQLSSKLQVHPQIIHPHEIYLEENIFLDPIFKPLQGIPIEYIRTRFAVLQHINQAVYFNLLPFVPLNVGISMKTSIASLLYETRYLLFYSTKDEFLYKVFLHSAHRGHEIPPPEVNLDPVKNIGEPITDSTQTVFSCAVCQLSQVPSQTFCVIPATGGDPPLAIVVKFSGEEVQGIIGSFRHFLATAVKEFSEPALNFFITCPSAAAGKNKDSLVLRPGPVTFGEERFLQCLGQFIGICLRADSPVPVSLLTPTWRSLLNASKEMNDVDDDLKEADILTSSFLDAFETSGEDETTFEQILENQEHTTFQHISMDGKTIVPLCPGGQNLPLRWANKGQFVRLVKKLREKELESSYRVNMILSGLSSVLPLPLFFDIFTSADLRTRVSGSPEVNLSLLKGHTHYQVGINESDRHIQFFWAALESLTPEELKNFIKFATNQDRLPASCPCQTSPNSSTADHVPPFPMKLAPIDVPHNASDAYINQRTIRAETCLFLIRLPPYTTYQVTRNQILFACNSRDDPLSG